MLRGVVPFEALDQPPGFGGRSKPICRTLSVRGIISVGARRPWKWNYFSFRTYRARLAASVAMTLKYFPRRKL